MRLEFFKDQYLFAAIMSALLSDEGEEEEDGNSILDLLEDRANALAAYLPEKYDKSTGRLPTKKSHKKVFYNQNTLSYRGKLLFRIKEGVTQYDGVKLIFSLVGHKVWC